MVENICSLKWLKLKDWPKFGKYERTLQIADLFSGCGGMSLGAMEACRRNGYGFNIKFAIEKNIAAANVYQENFNTMLEKLIVDDIGNVVSGECFETFTAKDLAFKRSVGKLDLIIAGPPCQGHSRLNNYTRSKDPRNLLYLKVARIAELFEPKIVVIENVLNVRYDKNNVVQKSDKAFKKMGYEVISFAIKTNEYGIAQRRVRHFQLAFKSKMNSNFDEYKDKSNISNVIDDLLDECNVVNSLFAKPSVTKHKDRIEYLFKNDIYDLPDSLRPNCHKNKAHTYPTSYGRLKWDEPCTTITRGFSTMGQGRFIHPLRKRTLSPHEAARIQGIPDFFRFTNVSKRTDLHLMIANAVPPKICMMIIDKYLKLNKGV